MEAPEYAPAGASASSVGSYAVQPMAKCENAHPDHRIEGLDRAMVHFQSARHDTEPERSDRAGQHEPVLGNSAAERDRTEDHRNSEPGFVDDRRAEEIPRRREEDDEHSRRNAMDQAQAGNAHGDPVQLAGLCK